MNVKEGKMASMERYICQVRGSSLNDEEHSPGGKYGWCLVSIFFFFFFWCYSSHHQNP